MFLVYTYSTLLTLDVFMFMCTKYIFININGELKTTLLYITAISPQQWCFVGHGSLLIVKQNFC